MGMLVIVQTPTFTFFEKVFNLQYSCEYLNTKAISTLSERSLRVVVAEFMILFTFSLQSPHINFATSNIVGTCTVLVLVFDTFVRDLISEGGIALFFSRSSASFLARVPNTPIAGLFLIGCIDFLWCCKILRTAPAFAPLLCKVSRTTFFKRCCWRSPTFSYADFCEEVGAKKPSASMSANAKSFTHPRTITATDSMEGIWGKTFEEETGRFGRILIRFVAAKWPTPIVIPKFCSRRVPKYFRWHRYAYARYSGSFSSPMKSFMLQSLPWALISLHAFTIERVIPFTNRLKRHDNILNKTCSNFDTRSIHMQSIYLIDSAARLAILQKI